jgi:hypothetical protein
MVHSNQGLFGEMAQEIRCYKAPPSLALTEHWNYTDRDKDFHGGYLVVSQAPLAHLGHPELVDLRWFAVPDWRWGEPVTDDHGDRLPHRRPYRRDGPRGELN